QHHRRADHPQYEDVGRRAVETLARHADTEHAAVQLHIDENEMLIADAVDAERTLDALAERGGQRTLATHLGGRGGQRGVGPIDEIELGKVTGGSEDAGEL